MFNPGDMVISSWNGQSLELQIVELYKDENSIGEMVWWCRRLDGRLFSVSEDGMQEEEWDDSYRYVSHYDDDEYPLYRECAYAEVYLKSMNKEWDDASNQRHKVRN